MKHPRDLFYDNENWEADYYKGWLILRNLEHEVYYSVQLKDTWTKQNITRFQFKEAVEKYGLDKACECFKKLSVEWQEMKSKPEEIEWHVMGFEEEEERWMAVNG